MPRNTVPGITPEGPSYNVVDVTPDLAEKWLGQNNHNRNLRDRAVAAYARDMKAGNWAENGESIKFAKDGTLLDGQHRLWAVVDSGVTVRMLVVTGLEGSDQETMDAGRKRSLSDALHLRGEINSSILGSVLRRTLMWEHGSYRNSGTYTPTNTECLTFLEAHPEVRESTQAAAALRKPSRLPASVIGLTHWPLHAHRRRGLGLVLRQARHRREPRPVPPGVDAAASRRTGRPEHRASTRGHAPGLRDQGMERVPQRRADQAPAVQAGRREPGEVPPAQVAAPAGSSCAAAPPLSIAPA